MKKQWFWLGWGILALAAIPVWLSQGCNSSFPALSSVVPTPLPNTMVSNFAQGTLSTNPSFSTTGYFSSQATGGAPGLTNKIDGSLTPNILEANPGSPSGSTFAVHVWGTQIDYCGNPVVPANTTYPAFQVFCYLKNDPANPYTDLSGFTGITFLVNIPSDDTNNPPAQRRFGIGAAPEVPPATAPGGLCPAPASTNCYNYFWGTLNKTAGWTPVTFLFSQLKMDQYYGYQNDGGTPATAAQTLVPSGLNPAFTYTGLDAGGNPCHFTNQVLFLLWKFGDNGNCGTTYTDFWFDNVQFF
jgi:hypothetical protein